VSYSVGQVAGFAGVTVRTLHHYDDIGLLAPGARSHAGHRRYNDADLDRLQQILSRSTRSPPCSTTRPRTRARTCAASTNC
jgi:DNA-binding transcriptional MerR regulator